jgi:glutathione S-transferase
MSRLILHGSLRSNFVRTCLLVLNEKEVDFEHDPTDPQTPEALQLHPWGKIPALTHGEVLLYETLAITNYIDDSFSGPKLKPNNPSKLALLNKWLSIYLCYMDNPIVRVIVIQRLLSKSPDENLIKNTIPDAEKPLKILDECLEKSNYIVDSEVSLADFLILPALDYLKMTNEGVQLLKDTTNINSWIDRMMERESSKIVLKPNN